MPTDNPDTIEDVLDKFHHGWDGYESLDKAVAKLQRMQDEAVIAELEPYTNLQELADGTHFEPCSICGQRSHHCMCDQALMFIERKATARIEALRTNKELE